MTLLRRERIVRRASFPNPAYSEISRLRNSRRSRFAEGRQGRAVRERRRCVTVIVEFTPLDGFGGATHRREERRERRWEGREDGSARRVIPVSNVDFISVQTQRENSRGGLLTCRRRDFARPRELFRRVQFACERSESRSMNDYA